MQAQSAPSALRADFEREALPHVRSLYGTALRLTRHARDAEDLVQETTLRAYRFFHHYQRGTNCKAWLFRILHNTFVTRYHKSRKEREMLLRVGAESALESARMPAASARTFSDLVVDALDALPADFRMAVVLCDVEELSYKEIADIMDCPVGTVMSRLHRGRKLLKESLFDHAVERGIIKAPADNTVDLATYRRQRDHR